MEHIYKTRPQENGQFNIYRENIHIAVYDTVEEKVSYVQSNYQRFSKQVTQEVDAIRKGIEEGAAEINATKIPEDDFPPEVPESTRTINPLDLVAEPSFVAPVEEVNRLKARVIRLEMEKGYLQDEITRLKRVVDPMGTRPAPFGGADLSTAPQTDPNLGDLTPAFVEWARENLPAEVFVKHYNNRLPKTEP